MWRRLEDKYMTFSEMKARTQLLLEVGGYTDSSLPADYGEQVNDALYQFSWEGEYCRATSSFTCTGSCSEYVLPSNIKRVASLYMNNDVLQQTTENAVSIYYPTWVVDAAGTPEVFWMVRPQVLRLYPTPSSAELITYRYVHTEDPLVYENDIPVAPALYHEAICLLAAYKYGKAFTRGEDTKRLETYFQEAMSLAASLRQSQAEQSAPIFRRLVRPTSPGSYYPRSIYRP